MTKKRKKVLERLSKVIASGSPFQHNAANMMAEIVGEEISVRDNKKERRVSQYYKDVTVLIAFTGNEVAILRFGLYGGHLSISSSALNLIQIKQELKKQMTDWQFCGRLPKTISKDWLNSHGVFFHQKKEKRDWYIFAESNCRGGDGYSLTRRGKLVKYYISEGFGIEIGYEVPCDRFYYEDASRTIKTFRYSGDRPPDWFEKVMVQIVTKLFEGRRVLAISAKPYCFETIYTRNEAEAHKNFRLVPVCPVIYLSNGEICDIWKRKSVDQSNHQNGIFLFYFDKNVYGVVEDRAGFGYLLPYTFQKIQFYPEGLAVGFLAQEIEKARNM